MCKYMGQQQNTEIGKNHQQVREMHSLTKFNYLILPNRVIFLEVAILPLMRFYPWRLSCPLYLSEFKQPYLLQFWQ